MNTLINSGECVYFKKKLKNLFKKIQKIQNHSKTF